MPCESMRLRAGLLTFASVMALSAGSTWAADAPAADAHRTSVIEGDVAELVVIAPKNDAAIVAPVKSSLAATEPQAVIDRAFIEENTPAVGDYTTTSALAPSMVSAGNANGPGATDGAKLSLRGVADGAFNITYDGVPWGDTNGPSHHANSFFPNSTIGGVVIDRGPGKATDIGQASFGGSVNLFSLPMEDQLGARQKVTFGSFGTWQSVTTLASGPIAQLHDANFIANFQEYHTDGYLSNSPADGGNQYLKVVLPLTSKIKVTALYTRNDDSYNLSDAGTGTIAEIEKFGAVNFGLCNDPTYSCYKGYNYTKKQTDFEYLREAGEISHGLTFENTSYSFWYSNKTLSGINQDWSKQYGAASQYTVALAPPATYPLPGKAVTTGLVGGIPGYWKRNEYRVTGDVLKLNQDLGFGVLTVGGLYEIAKTKRFITDIALPAPGSGVTGFNTPIYNINKVASGPITPAVAGCYGYTTDPVASAGGLCETPLNVAYNEYSGWRHYQLFSQFEWKATDQLTITPGVKYLNFNLYVHAPVEQTIEQPVYIQKTFEKTLGYLTANYRVSPNWSAYAQASQGFLVPNIGSMYVYNQNYQSIQPQESMAYQLGTVYSKGAFTFDADVYSINFTHKLQSNVNAANQTYYTNSGGADYRGFEGQGTYVVAPGFAVFMNYSNNQAVGKSDAVNPGGNGKQLASAPRWTMAQGVRIEQKHLFMGNDDLILSLDDKFVGPQMAIAASGSAAPTGLIKPFSEADFSSTYRFGQYAILFQVLNLTGHQSITGGKWKTVVAGTDQLATSTATGGGANTPQYQTPRSFQLTLKAAF